MDSEVLFTVTRECLDTGLRGYPVGYCTTSYVHPHLGLFYVGRPISELAYKEAEEVIYLLYYGKEGSKSEIEQFKNELVKRAHVDSRVLEQIRLLPRVGQPMKLFAASLLIEGMLEGVGDYREDCLNLIARAPTLVACLINHHAGWGEGPKSRPELGYIENFVAQLALPGGVNKDLATAMKIFNILHYDHGGGNLSTFVGKAVASGLEDMHGSMSAAMSALAGHRHGRANQDCLEFVEKVLQELGENATAGQVENLLREKLAKGDLIYGFGHAVLRVEDPRAAIFYDLAVKKYEAAPIVKIALLLRLVGPKVLAENPKIHDIHPNVDAISSVVLKAAGFDYPHYFAVLFGMARVVGISRQIVYERLEARGGKGTPIVRPKYLYAGDETVSG
ncbi:MAG: citrate (Si)-synthase [Verrucomicrobia bacterium]|nr:citrate (Si)-synthase [Verrucomicrobiota bacterium]